MAGVATQSNAWARRFQPADDAETRLVCFPHAGGSASFFFPVAQTMAPDVDVLAIQYPGRQDRRFETPVDSVHTLADLVVEELTEWADRPLTLFGHSMGAVLAYEVAHRLRERGITPLGLFASGRRAPSTYRGETVHLRDDAGLIAEMQELSGTDAAILADEELLRMILPAIRGDYRAIETYRHRTVPPLDCPVVALVGDEDPQVTADEARAWEQHTNGAFRLRSFPGGHFYINAHAQDVMREIADFIRTARRPG